LRLRGYYRDVASEDNGATILNVANVVFRNGWSMLRNAIP